VFGYYGRAVSRCPSKERGGELGWFRRGTMVPRFEDACFSAKPGSLIKVETVRNWVSYVCCVFSKLPNRRNMDGT
jgi:peptidyl-prolyl cis-trans isomerase C